MHPAVLHCPTLTELPLQHKIGEGQYREVYQSGPFVIKVLKRILVKSRPNGGHHLPLRQYVYRKYGIVDFNQHEFANYQKLAAVAPPSLTRYFNPLHWAGHYRGLSLSLSDLVRNEDGSPAQPLARSGQIRDASFWNTLQALEAFLLNAELYFTGVNRDNLLVQKYRTGWQPVMVDYKWLGREAYPCQFWLSNRWLLRSKIRAKFREMEKLHRLE